MHRFPAVAGSFYPADAPTLAREVRAFLGDKRSTARAVAVLAPHAGYVYSGPCAGRAYGEIDVPELAIILCPNHTGLGKPLALMDEGEWETPLGPVRIETALARQLLALDSDLSVDPLAHLREHALEVQLPFLQVLRPSIRFVPVCVGTNNRKALLGLGDAIAEAVRDTEDDVLIVISSDMSHYIPFEEARARDTLAIERMEKLDAEGLLGVVRREAISMCGYCPAVAGIRAARVLGAAKGRLVAYTSSGDRTGDYHEVVAYASMVFN